MYENLKERLRNYKKYKSIKNELEFKITELEQNVGLTEMVQGEAISKTYKISSTTENQALELAVTKDKLNNLKNSYDLEITRIENALNGLEEKKKKAVELRYIERRSLESVCYLIDRSLPTVKKYLAAGLKEMNSIIDIC